MYHSRATSQTSPPSFCIVYSSVVSFIYMFCLFCFYNSIAAYNKNPLEAVWYDADGVIVLVRLALSTFCVCYLFHCPHREFVCDIVHIYVYYLASNWTSRAWRSENFRRSLSSLRYLYACTGRGVFAFIVS